ncbi:MAG: hypothetical protein ABS76_25885 [Pelagibacterium sp. SCN 64-44]|nr:MAG: hypothetical protein ABS76_25885 [Pelagibacterium sp. SCN 64-44]
MLCSGNIEHAGDVVKLNLTRRMKNRIRSGAEFSDEQLAQLRELSEVIYASLRLLPAALSTDDVRASARLAAQKDVFRELEQDFISRHMTSTLNKANLSQISALFVDLIRDMHRINSHIASAGYPILSAAGLLNSTRLADW